MSDQDPLGRASWCVERLAERHRAAQPLKLSVILTVEPYSIGSVSCRSGAIVLKTLRGAARQGKCIAPPFTAEAAAQRLLRWSGKELLP